MKLQTSTAVHSPLTRETFIKRRELKENSLSLSVLLYAQMLITAALSLMNVASTASYLSLLFSLLPAALVYMLSSFAVKKGKTLTSPAAFLFALLFFSDMALNLFSLTEITGAYVLPKYPRMAICLPAALLTGLALTGKQQGSARRTSVFLILFFLGALAVCLFFAVPESDIGYLFPLLGYGETEILRGGICMTGSLWIAAALPYFTHAPGLRVKTALFPLIAVFVMTGVLLVCACLLPAPLFPGDWGFVLRLQLLMEMSPNTLTWSLMLISRMLLFLCAFASAGDFCCECLRKARKGRKANILLLAALSVPLSLLPFDKLLPFLSLALPLRFLIAFAGAVLPLFKKETP
ncbi:MAG: GerAB/ArcD/ProY family transporter [Clostridia bacterium]|nr:GerAB/ArcD/ProY family transporter [Clostridia bacterium]